MLLPTSDCDGEILTTTSIKEGKHSIAGGWTKNYNWVNEKMSDRTDSIKSVQCMDKQIPILIGWEGEDTEWVKAFNTMQWTAVKAVTPTI